MSKPASRKYAEITFWEFFHLVGNSLLLPVVILRLLIFNTIKYRSGKEIKRNLAIGFVRWVTDTFSISQIQFLLPSTISSCELWGRLSGTQVSVERLIEDTTLIWIGSKKKDRPVILFLPGGAFFYPITPSHLDFWRYVRNQLAKSNREVNFAILDYALYPTATFPTQLQQATIALEHLIATGVHPSNLHLVGDSSGAQIILSLLSHSLHPLQIHPDISSPNNVPKQLRQLRLSAPISGVYLMSPWVCLNSRSPSFLSNAPMELFSTATITKYGLNVSSRIKDSAYMPYLEPANAPQGWFEGLGYVVERMLITAGDAELFRDDIQRFSEAIETMQRNVDNEKGAKGKRKRLPNVDFRCILHKGVHVDPYIDFAVNLPEDQLVGNTKFVVEWLQDGLNPLESETRTMCD